MSFRVADGISSVDAFNALYKNARVIGMGIHNPCAGEAPGSAWNAIQIFNTYCLSGKCDYVRGKRMKVNFRKFPELDVTEYDQFYGEGAAKKAIQSYRKIRESRDPEANDLNGDPCAFFTQYWREKTPENQRKDLEHMFGKCERLEAAEKQAETLVNGSTSNAGFDKIFDKCKAKYAITSPPVNYVGHDYKPCQEALNHFNMLLEIGRHGDSHIDGLTICRYNSYLPFIKRCQKQSSEVTIPTAKKVLESQISKL